MTDIILTDRSRITAAEKCLRYRYWHYEHDGIGLEQGGQWLDPLIGTAVHTAIEYVLAGKQIEESVALGREVMLAAQREGPILVYKQSIRPDWDFAEGMELMEALVRGWCAIRLADIVANYDILFIEREMT